MEKFTLFSLHIRLPKCEKFAFASHEKVDGYCRNTKTKTLIIDDALRHPGKLGMLMLGLV